VSQRARITAYLVLTFALSAYFYARIVSEGKMRDMTVLGLMWCPAAAATVVRLITQRNLRGTGWGWGATRWQTASYLIPFGVALAVYGLVWLTGIGAVDVTALKLGTSAAAARISPALSFSFLATIGFIVSAAFALGEEIGWRGFLVPELSRVMTFTGTAAISGVVWAVYHYPIILFADYNSPAPKWFGISVFSIGVVAMGFVLAWLRLRSGSMWTAVVFHASHNLFVQQVFDRITIDRGWTTYLTTEFGIGLAAGYALVAIYFWRRRAELAVQDRRHEVAHHERT
jgi:membrane protease YdiL (CAAX protease family)